MTDDKPTGDPQVEEFLQGFADAVEQDAFLVCLFTLDGEGRVKLSRLTRNYLKRDFNRSVALLKKDLAGIGQPVTPNNPDGPVAVKK